MDWTHARLRFLFGSFFCVSLFFRESSGAESACPIVFGSGQPACGLSVDVGSSAPNPTNTYHVGNPVDVVTGNKYESALDIRVGDSPLFFMRHYNSSQSVVNVGLGNGWRHSYSVVLTQASNQLLRIAQSDGRLIDFNKVGDHYKAGNEDDGYIIEQPDGKHKWVIPDGRSLTFFGSFLVSITLKDSEVLNLYYRQSRLASVSDDTGKMLEFHYADGRVGLPFYNASDEHYVPPGHLIEVKLPDDTSVTYQYDRKQNLVAALYPRGLKQDSSVQYKYEKTLNSSLLTERANGLGKVQSKWSYDEMQRVNTYRSGQNVAPDGGNRGLADLTLMYLAGNGPHAGITQVLSRKGIVDIFDWQVDNRGRVQTVKKQTSDLASAINRKSNEDFKPDYPDDRLTIVSVDRMGYPSELDYQQENERYSHKLRSQYSQHGKLLSVEWESGYLQSFNYARSNTRKELMALIQEYSNSKRLPSDLLSAIAEQGLIASIGRKFLEDSVSPLTVGSVIDREKLIERWQRSVQTEMNENPKLQRSKSSINSKEGDDCKDPVAACEQLLRVRDYAELAECVYIDSVCNTRFREANLSQLGLHYSDLVLGAFRAEVYYDSRSDEYVVAFAGSAVVSDWYDNISQEFGHDSPQYERAVQLARMLLRDNPGKIFSFTGHSLGGGLATAAAAAVSGDATVFNPAALDPDTALALSTDYAHAQSNTQIYVVDGEIANQLQTSVDSANMPPGIVHVLPRPNYPWVVANVNTSGNIGTYPIRLALTLHRMNAVNQSIVDLLTRNQCSQ